MERQVRGTLVPSTFVPKPPTIDEQNIASIFWGFSLAFIIWTGNKGIKQSRSNWARVGRLSAYVSLIWAEWTSCLIIGIITWLYLRDYIGPSFEFFFFVLVMWTVQVQCLLQIIINRISLLMEPPGHAPRLKWAVFIFVLLVNISVFCIWIPARLQISQRYIHINAIWDRIEKGIILLVDLGLNLTFIYLVRSQLIHAGLEKYRSLFRFNLAMIFISISLDVSLIALMSLPNTFVYAQFHPLAYLVKLHIELNMAELIAKIVRTSNEMNPHHDHDHDGSSTTDVPPADTRVARVRRQLHTWHGSIGLNLSRRTDSEKS